MHVVVKAKTVYGRSVAEPINDLAKLFCELLSTKNLSIENLKIIQRMGIEIKFDTSF